MHTRDRPDHGLLGMPRVTVFSMVLGAATAFLVWAVSVRVSGPDRANAPAAR